MYYFTAAKIGLWERVTQGGGVDFFPAPPIRENPSYAPESSVCIFVGL